MSSPLKQNTATIQELLNTINSLPDAGTDLPELSNEGSSAELFAGKELIDGNGEKVTGTFTIDSELSTQDNLISQIQTALQNKASATGEDVTSETSAYTAKLATLETAITALETELQGKASGGSGGGSVETCTVTFDNISQDCPIVVVSAIVFENGIYQTYTNFSDISNQLYTITVPNVVCGSEIGLGSCFNTGYGVAPYIEISGTASFNLWDRLAGVATTFMTMTFTAPSVPNENCTISFMGN